MVAVILTLGDSSRKIKSGVCQEYIFNIIWGRNPKCSVWIPLGVLQCHTLFLDHSGIDFWPWCYKTWVFGPRSAVGNVSGYRCVSDCRSRGREFDPGPVPYFRGDWSWNNFHGHSPPFRWFIQEGLLSVTSESMCTNYWLTACSSLPRKKCG